MVGHDCLQNGVVALTDGVDEALHQFFVYLSHGLCGLGVGDVVDVGSFLFCEIRICRVSVVGWCVSSWVHTFCQADCI